MPPPGYEPFLKAICADPEDDTVRLVYADWLDENGDAADRSFAEQIRAQIETSGERLELPWRHPAIEGITGDVSRGFLAHLDLSAQLYLDHAAELFAQHPITAVYLSDRQPAPILVDGTYAWSCMESWEASPELHSLPELFREPLAKHPLIYPLLGGHVRATMPLYARLAVSEVAVNLARRLNDLLPLPLSSDPRRTAPQPR